MPVNKNINPVVIPVPDDSPAPTPTPAPAPAPAPDLIKLTEAVNALIGKLISAGILPGDWPLP